MRTGKPTRGRTTTEVKGQEFSGINQHDSIGKLESGDYLDLVNLDIYDGYVKQRRGSRATDFELDTKTEVHTSITFRNEDLTDEVTLLEIESDNKDGHYYGSGVNDCVKEWGTTNNFTTSGGGFKNTYIYTDGKIAFISPDGNYIFEIVEVNPVGSSVLGDRYELWARQMGLEELKIYAVHRIAGVEGDIGTGKYIYAVERIRKDAVIGAPITSSSPNRFQKNYTFYAMGTVATGEFATFNVIVQVDDILDSPETTHIRIWRTKNLRQDQETFETLGDPSTLYLIGEVDYATAIAPGAGNNYIFVDDKPDEELPVVALGSQVLVSDPVNGPVYTEMSPLPPAYTGTFFQNRLWVGHIVAKTTGFKNDNSNVVASEYSGGLYGELYDPLFGVIPCDSGDGHRITAIHRMGDDLVVFKETSTGRIPGGDPSVPYDRLDADIGIAYLNSSAVISRFGVMAVVNDLEKVMLFTPGLNWTEYIGNTNFTSKIQGAYTITEQELIGKDIHLKGVYWEGKILLHLGTGRELQVLHVSEGFFWTSYHLPFGEGEDVLFGTPNIECLLLRDGGKECAFAIWNNPAIQYLNDSALLRLEKLGDSELAAQQDIYAKPEGENLVYERIQWSVITPPYQHDEGRSLIEQRYLSVVAGVHKAMKVSVYVANLTTLVVEEDPFELEPTDFTQGAGVTPPGFEVNESSMVEYQYYASDKSPARTRLYGERLIYKIEGEGKVEMYPPKLYCWIAYGTRKPGYNFSTYTERLLELQTGLGVWLTRTDMFINYIDKSAVPIVDQP